MRTAIVDLKGVTPYQQGRYFTEPVLEGETKDEWEARVWRNRMHCDKDGMCYIPGICFQLSLARAAELLAMGIPGKGKDRYTKHFQAGIMVADEIKLGIHRDEVPCADVPVPPTGKRSDGSRVIRHFPTFYDWAGRIRYHIFDKAITDEVFRVHLEAAGQIVGIGVWRPTARGHNGRYVADKIKFVDGIGSL